MLKVLLACLLTLTAVSTAAARPVITSGCEYDYPPFCIVNPDSSVDGFSVELLRAALREMGHEVSFTVGSWMEVKQLLADRRIQVLPLVGRTPEREALYDFTVPYLTMHGALIVREGSTIRTVADLNGKRVAVLAGDNAEEFARRAVPGAVITATTTSTEALQQLAAGGQDAVIMQKLLALQLMRQQHISGLTVAGMPLTTGFTQSFCFAVAKGDHRLLGVLNEGLALVIANGTYAHLQAKWFAPLEAQSRRTLVIGGDANYPPYEFLDEEGKPAGYNVDLSRALAAHLGMPVEIRLGEWNEIRDALARGEIDAIHGMFYLPERRATFDFSAPHTVVSHAVVTRRDGPDLRTLADLAGRRVIVMRGDIMEDVARTHGLGDRLTVAGSLTEVLRLLASGAHDAALVARIPALACIAAGRLNNLRVPEESVFSPEYCYAVRQGDAALLARLDEALSAVKASGDYRRIYTKWLGVHEQRGTDWLTIIRYVALALIPVFLLLLGSMLWSRALRRQVTQRTAELQHEIGERQRAQEELQQHTHHLERLVQEKSLQLTVQGRTALLGKIAAGIAHDLNNPLSIVSGNLQMLELLCGQFTAVPPGTTRHTDLQHGIAAALTDARSGCARIIETCDRLRRFARPVHDVREPFDLNEALKTAVIVTRDQWKKQCGEIDAVYHPQPLTVYGTENDIAHVLSNLLDNAADAIAPGGNISVNCAPAADGRYAVVTVSDNGPGIPAAYRAQVGHSPFTTKPPEHGTGLGLQLSYDLVHDHGGTIAFTTSDRGTTFTVTLPLYPETAP